MKGVRKRKREKQCANLSIEVNNDFIRKKIERVESSSISRSFFSLLPLYFIDSFVYYREDIYHK